MSGNACSGLIRVRSLIKSRKFIPSTYSMIMKCRLVVLANVDDLDDVGMVQPDSGLGLLVETGQRPRDIAANRCRRTLIATGPLVGVCSPR